jgi:hypothetical protein
LKEDGPMPIVYAAAVAFALGFALVTVALALTP